LCQGDEGLSVVYGGEANTPQWSWNPQITDEHSHWCNEEQFARRHNTERLHSSLDYVSPNEFERRWRAGNQHKEEPTS
jgi:hypothetical protein